MIGIIGAMQSEVDGLKKIMAQAETKTVSSVEFVKGKISGIDIVVAQAGVGKVNAALTAQTMILVYGVDKIINIGVAGGLEPSLKIGDVVIADKVCEHDMDTTPLGDLPGFITGLDRVYMECDKEITELLYESSCEMDIHTVKGTIASGDQFISDNLQRTRIIDTFNGYAAEMEGAAIGHVCTMNNVPFCVLRAISDGANDDSVMDFPTFVKMAADRSIEIIKIMLNKMQERNMI